MRAAAGLAALVFAWAVPAAPIAGSRLAGDWQGVIGGSGRRVVVLITGDEGLWKGMLFSIDQSSHGLPLDAVSLRGRVVAMDAVRLGGHYQGTLARDGGSIRGQWSLGGVRRRLALRKVDREHLWVRCVEPERVECHRRPGDGRSAAPPPQ